MGESIRIWRDNWIPRAHGLKPVGSVRHCRLRWVSHLIDDQSRSWDETLVRRYFYACDVEEILKIKIPSSACSDQVSWNFEKSGIFSVRSARSMVKGRSVAALLQLMGERYGRPCGLFKFLKR